MQNSEIFTENTPEFRLSVYKDALELLEIHRLFKGFCHLFDTVMECREKYSKDFTCDGYEYYPLNNFYEIFDKLPEIFKNDEVAYAFQKYDWTPRLPILKAAIEELENKLNSNNNA